MHNAKKSLIDLLKLSNKQILWQSSRLLLLSLLSTTKQLSNKERKIMDNELFITKLNVQDNRDSCKTTLHFFLEGENILENLKNRRCRPYTTYRTLFSEIEKRLGLKEHIQASWSQYAGCKCGCSPAFIIKNAHELGLYRKCIYVTITNSLQTELKFEFAKSA